MRCVLDTNVLVAGLRSQRGASFELLSLVGGSQFEVAVSVPLVLEYESVLLGMLSKLHLERIDVDDFLNYICSVAHQQPVFFLWRPKLRDSKDDMVLELAVGSSSDVIVTFNQRDFEGCERFGIESMTPGNFIHHLGAST